MGGLGIRAPRALRAAGTPDHGKQAHTTATNMESRKHTQTRRGQLKAKSETPEENTNKAKS